MIHVGNKEHGRRIMQSIQSDFANVTMEVISRSENGILYGGVIYENYTGKGGSVLVHIGAFRDNWINRDMLYVMFDYPFRQLDCKQAFCQVAGKNVHARKFCKSFGWEELVTLEAVFPDDDMILMRMKRDQCRFLDIKPRTIKSRRVSENG